MVGFALLSTTLQCTRRVVLSKAKPTIALLLE